MLFYRLIIEILIDSLHRHFHHLSSWKLPPHPLLAVQRLAKDRSPQGSDSFSNFYFLDLLTSSNHSIFESCQVESGDLRDTSWILASWQLEGDDFPRDVLKVLQVDKLKTRTSRSDRLSCGPAVRKVPEGFKVFGWSGARLGFKVPRWPSWLHTFYNRRLGFCKVFHAVGHSESTPGATCCSSFVRVRFRRLPESKISQEKGICWWYFHLFSIVFSYLVLLFKEERGKPWLLLEIFFAVYLILFSFPWIPEPWNAGLISSIMSYSAQAIALPN